jgi:hypothetical protein
VVNATAPLYEEMNMNNLSLYELSSTYLKALDDLTDPELDLPLEVVNDTLEALSDEMETKAINVTKFMRNMEATTKAIKEAEAEMAKRRKSLENRIKWMKDYLKGSNIQALLKLNALILSFQFRKTLHPLALQMKNQYLHNLKSRLLAGRSIKQQLKTRLNQVTQYQVLY